MLRKRDAWAFALEALYAPIDDDASWSWLVAGAMRRLFLPNPTRRELYLARRLQLHLETAWRLRREPEVLKAVLTPTGVRPTDAPDLWSALLEGRYGVASRTENGSRRYLVLENSPHARALLALTPREREVLRLAALGSSTKGVSYDLGLTPSTVSATLTRVASKLGLATSLDLLRLAATLVPDSRAHAVSAKLTTAERAVLELIREGMSNEEIARMRRRSVRTIANQVASLLQKTNSGSRRSLLAIVSGTLTK